MLNTRPALPGMPDPIAQSSLDYAASVHQFTDSVNVCFEPTVCQELDLGFRYPEEEEGEQGVREGEGAEGEGEETSQPPTSK